MSRIRDIANILSANTAMATDAEVSSAVSSAVSTHATAANGHIGRGTTAQRPEPASIGDTYFDTTLSALITYRSTGWEKVSPDPAPQIGSISPTTAAVAGTTITITGSNFKSGLTVQFIGTNAVSYNSPVATFVSAIAATATTPALPVEYEPYDIKITNNDNQFAILENSLDAGGTPVWNTASGTIATILKQSSLNASVSATDPDGTSVVYSSSNLPIATPTPVTFQVTNSGSGAYLMDGVSNGTITLTRGGTYTFNVNASGHPFYIQTTGNGYNAYNVYSTGVTGAGAQVGTVTFTVPSNAPNTLYYQCQYHSAMYGQINIISASSWVSLNSSTGALTGTAPNISSNTTYSFDVSASDGVNSSSRSFNIEVTMPINVQIQYLVIAGGGSGGTADDGGAGGGAGGYRCSVPGENSGRLSSAESVLTIQQGQQVAVVVGLGGLGVRGQGYDDNGGLGFGKGNNGQNSQFGSITSIGAGGGGGVVITNNSTGQMSGGNGGSGGGAGQRHGFGAVAGTGTPGQGFDGGSLSSSTTDAGAGGGGAGSKGADASGNTGGTGGSGITSSITGSAITRAGGGGAGGGGPRAGGSGGGGASGDYSSGGVQGTDGTGSGGGASNNHQLYSGRGGNGIVIIRYSDTILDITSIPPSLTYTKTNISGYKVYQFTAGSGTITL